MMDQALATPVILGPALTEQQAREIYRQGEEAVVFALLSLAQKMGEPPVVSPTTPSAMIPPYLKPKANGRRKRPGRKDGHPGSRRPTPEVINDHVDHRLSCCPDCHGPLTRTNQSRTRITEDIPEQITPVVTEHTIHRDWCPHCQKAVEPVVTNALPGATLGNRTLVLSAQRLEQIGYKIAIFPATGFLAAGAALESIYQTLKHDGSSVKVTAPLQDFTEFAKLMGFQDVWDFDKRHAD